MRARRPTYDRPNLSSAKIAKRFKLTTSTLNRIENLNIKNPEFEQIAKVLIGTGNTTELNHYIEDNYPSVSNIIKEYYQLNKTAETLSQDFRDSLKDSTTYKILTLILCRPTTSIDYIQENFGLEGLKILKKLSSKKLIRINGNTISTQHIKEQIYLKSIEEVKSLTHSILKNSFNYEGKDEGNAENFLSFDIHTVNAYRAMPKISKILEEVQQKFNEYKASSLETGEDVVFLSTVADTLQPNNVRFYRKQSQKLSLLSK